MTKKELIEQLKYVEEDAVICGVQPMGGDYYEISSIENMPKHTYFDLEDDEKTADLIIIA